MSNRAKIVAIPKTTTTTFSPTSIAGCALWLDGADPAGTGIVPASGNLATWVDKSGGGINAIAGTSVYPQFTTSYLNGLGVVGLTNSADYFTVANNFNTSSLAYIFVMKPTSANTGGYCGILSTDTPNAYGRSIALNNMNFQFEYYSNFTNTSIAINSTTWYIISLVFNGTSSITLSYNGTISTYGGSGTGTNTNGLTIGSYNDTSSYTTFNANFYLAEAIVYTSSLTQTQFQTVESYLAQKWGLTSNLAAGHPGLTTPVYTITIAVPRQKIRTIPRAATFTNFVPTSITGCSLWLDAADSSSITGTTTVTAWADKSGLGNSPTFGTNKPSFIGNYIDTENSNVDFIIPISTINRISGQGGVLFFVFADKQTNSNYPALFSDGTPLNRFHQILLNSYGYEVAGNKLSQTGLNAMNTTNFIIYAFSYITGSSIIVRVNGSEIISSSSYAPNPSGQIYIGKDGWGDGTGNLKLNEILFYKNTLTTTQIQTVESYLAQKWSLKSSLVAGHPGLTTTVYGTTSAPTVRQKIRYIAPSVAIVVAPTVYTVTTSGLVYYLDAAQTASYPGSGSTWSNLVGSGNAVTLYNSPTYSASGGGSLLFDGTTQYGRSVSPVNLPNWTMEAWYYYNGGSTAGNIVIDMFPSAIQYSLGSFNNGWISTGTYNPTSTTSAYVPTSGNWYHIVGTYDGTNLKLYINGAVVYIKAISITPSNGGVGFQIMTQYDTGHSQYLAGNLAILRMYNRGLTTIEVNTNYNAERSRFSLTSVNSPISYTIPSVSFSTSGLSFYIDISIQASYYNSSAATLYDLTGSSMVITLYNSPTYSTSGGGSLLFNGTSQYGRSSAPLALTNWTMDAWYYYNGGSTNGNIVIDMFSSAIQYSLGFFNNGWISTGTYSPTASTAAYIPISGNWYHFAGTYDGTNVKLYVNGVVVYFKTITITPSNGGIGFQIMTQYDIGHSSYLAGNLAILRMYNRGLSATEINTNYNAERARFSLAYVSPPISYTIPSVSFSTSGLSFYIDIAIQASYYNSSATTLYDLTGSSMVITLYNSPTYSTAGGGCLIFNGTTQYGRSSAPLPLTNWTIEAWYYYSGGSTSGNIVIDMFSSSMQYTLGSFGGGWISAGMYNPNAYTGSFTPTVGNWYQVVGTYDGVNVKLYINGALSSSVASTGRPANGGIGFQIMTQYDVGHSQYLAGNLAILRMYNRALILSEVTQNYNAENSRFTPT